MKEGEVSVRELRQNLSVYLRKVREGRTLAVTSRGERVALLAPIGSGSRLERLQAEGRISAPQAPWIVPEPVALDGAPTPTRALLQERAEDDR